MDNNKLNGISRRDFVKKTSLLGSALAVSTSGLANITGSLLPSDIHPREGRETQHARPGERAMIGLQTGVGTFAGPAMLPFLDDIQSRAYVNTLFPFMFTYIASRVGPHIKNFHGGDYATVHTQYYKDIHLNPATLRAPEFGNVDFLAVLIPEAKKRNMKIYPYILEDNRRPMYVEGMDQLYEIDLYGRRATRHPAGPCYNNPYYQNLMLGLVEDYSRSYDIDGIMWGAERQGPMNNALGAYHHGIRSDPGRVTCFCPYCVAKAQKQGIDVNRVKQGFQALEQFVNNGRKGQRPGNGYYVTFWSILLKFPEVLIWESFWAESLRTFQENLSKKAKSINPALQIGFHLWHNISFNPIYRAEQDYQQYAGFSDFIEPVLYNHCAGERMASYVDSVSQNLYGDFNKEQATELSYRMLNYQEKPYDQLAKAGFSGDYVFRETKRAKDDMSTSKTKVWPGIGIDVPAPTPSTSEIVKNAVLAAFKGGADGVLLSRKYDEMKPDHLSSAGEAIREMGYHS